jgi:hypothetical protein
MLQDNPVELAHKRYLRHCSSHTQNTATWGRGVGGHWQMWRISQQRARGRGPAVRSGVRLTGTGEADTKTGRWIGWQEQGEHSSAELLWLWGVKGTGSLWSIWKKRGLDSQAASGDVGWQIDLLIRVWRMEVGMTWISKRMAKGGNNMRAWPVSP